MERKPGFVRSLDICKATIWRVEDVIQIDQYLDAECIGTSSQNGCLGRVIVNVDPGKKL